MAAQVIHYRFKLRRAAAARWTSTNDLLYQGEIGVETDTNFMKLGDGVTHWNNLPYWNGAPISGFNNIADGQVLAWDATNSQWVPADAGKQYQAGSGINIANASTATPTINSTLGSIALSGRVSAYSNLPTGLTTSDAGTAYLNDGDGLVYVWDGSAWPSSGNGVAASGLTQRAGNQFPNTTGNVTIPKSASTFMSISLGGVKYLIPAYQQLTDNIIVFFLQSGCQGGYYDPSDLSTLFQDVAMTTPVTAAGQSVAAMKDKSGNDHHVTQSTSANRPTYKVDSNGNSYLAFNGSSDYLAANGSILSNGDPMTIVAAASLDSKAGYSASFRTLCAQGTPFVTNQGWSLVWRSSDDVLELVINNSGYFKALNPATLSTPYVLSMITNSTSTGLWQNGTSLGSFSSGHTSTAGSEPFRIGYDNTGDRYWNGKIYGLVVYGADESSNRHTIEHELGARAGLTI